MSDEGGGGPAQSGIAGRIVDGAHLLAARIYYEDTDFSGTVYHANYLKYCERGRSDFLRLIGVHHHELNDRQAADERLAFVVTEMNLVFRKSARIDDVVEVRTRFVGLGGARFELRQEVRREGDLLFAADVKAALVDGSGRPRRLPADMRERFRAFAERP